jgi:hypothetical protein
MFGWVAVAVLPAVALVWSAIGASAATPATLAYDVSFPQCGKALPSSASLLIIGANHGKPFTANPCTANQYQWAKHLGATAAYYVNSSNPGTKDAHWQAAGSDYQYGRNAAADAFNAISKTTKAASGHRWWVDVETMNTWSSDKAANVAVIQGMVDELTARSGVVAGVYSTTTQWARITGGAQASAVPSWLAPAKDRTAAAAACATPAFTGGSMRLVQYPSNGFDADYICP